MSALIEATDLVRTLAGEVPVTLIDHVDLKVEPGEFVAIMGPSGSGKSSLLYLLGLLDVPTGGRVLLEGRDTSDYDENTLANTRLAKLGFVFQFHFLLAEFTAVENIALPIRRLGKLSDDEAEQRAAQLLAALDMGEHRHKRPSQMSGGQRQRVAVARALANDPVLLLADEPTGNLDTASSANVRQILKDLTRSTGKTVIAVTHDPDFAAAADRCIHLVDGKIV